MVECLKESVVNILKYKVENEVSRENCSLVSLNDVASRENVEGLITCPEPSATGSISTVHIFTPYIFQSTPGSTKWTLSFRFPE